MKFFRVTAALALAAACATVAIWRSGVLTASTDRERTRAETERMVHEGQAAFAKLWQVDLASLTADDIEGLLMAAAVDAPPQGDPELSRSDVAELTRKAAHLVYQRFVAGSPGEYWSWREREGYKLDAAAVRTWGVDADYQILVGGQFPGYERLPDIFNALWGGVRQYKGGTSWPTGVAGGPDGAVVSSCTMKPDGVARWPKAKGQLGTDVWEGRVMAGHRIWLRDPHGGIAGFLREYGTFRVAAVAFVLQYPGGDRYPIRFVFAQEPASKVWWLTNVQVMNMPRDRLTVLEF